MRCLLPPLDKCQSSVPVPPGPYSAPETLGLSPLLPRFHLRLFIFSGLFQDQMRQDEVMLCKKPTRRRGIVQVGETAEDVRPASPGERGLGK